MKEKKVYILLISILIIASLFILKKDEKTFKINGIKYAVKVNGVPEDRIPEKGSYTVTITCAGADGNWNYDNWEAEISNITGSVACNLSFDSRTKITLNDHIIQLLGENTSVLSTSNNDGSTLEETNSSLTTDINGIDATSTDYRYRGTNPNNYIKFNNELWRIIGVFDQYSHGQTGEQLVKIIRNDPIGDFIYEDSNVNEKDIIDVLNIYYYNSNDGNEEFENLSNNAYYEYFNSDYDFTSSGIKTKYHNMIRNVTWYQGTDQTLCRTKECAYTYERKYLTGINNFVGLMYISDYGYGAESLCSGFGYNNMSEEACKDNWLFIQYDEWTITPHYASSRIDGYFIIFNGYIEEYAVPFEYPGAIRPTLYLDPSVYYLSGTGTQADPYIIAMD